MSANHTEGFYQLLRLSLGLAQEFPVDANVDMWRWLYQILPCNGPVKRKAFVEWWKAVGNVQKLQC